MRSKVKRKFKLNIYYPWLKFAFPILIFLFFFAGARGLIFRKVLEKEIIPRAPMIVQARVPERVFRGDLSGKKLVALTFDDGPSRITTPQLLDILRDKKAVATFFELGTNASWNPEIVKRVVEQGNELGSHTNSHQNLVQISLMAVEDDKKQADMAFQEVLGEIPKIVRPPYGNFDERIMEILDAPVILWSVDTRDWESKDAEKIKEVVFSQTRDGAILLFHDIYQSTIDAIPEIIDRLREEGFEFVTISEMATLKGVELEKGEYYREF